MCLNGSQNKQRLFRREVDENRAVLGYYLATSGNFLPTSRDNLSVPSTGSEIQKQAFLLDSWPPKKGRVACPETAVVYYHCSPSNNPEQHSYEN